MMQGVLLEGRVQKVYIVSDKRFSGHCLLTAGQGPVGFSRGRDLIS